MGLSADEWAGGGGVNSPPFALKGRRGKASGFNRWQPSPHLMRPDRAQSHQRLKPLALFHRPFRANTQRNIFRHIESEPRMKFTEEKLEQAVIELLQAEGYEHRFGEEVHKELPDVLLRDDFRQYLLNRYAADGITPGEIEAILRQLDSFPASALYDSNKAILKLLADGFALKRADRSPKDLYIQLLDFSSLPAAQEPQTGDVPSIVAEKPVAPYAASPNIFKIVSQLEIHGSDIALFV